jgi:hypothetical protein
MRSDVMKGETDGLVAGRPSFAEGRKLNGKPGAGACSDEEGSRLLEELYVLGCAIAGASADLYALMASRPVTTEKRRQCAGKRTLRV